MQTGPRCETHAMEHTNTINNLKRQVLVHL